MGNNIDLDKIIRGWERCRKCGDLPLLFSESYHECEYTIGVYCGQHILINDTLRFLRDLRDNNEKLEDREL